MIQCVIFNVRLGQCIAILPVSDLEYLTLIDCGHEDQFHPIDFLIRRTKGLIFNNNKVKVGNLTLTNYDHDHFSGLPYLLTKSEIKTVIFSENLTNDHLQYMKEDITDALKAVMSIKKNYTSPAISYYPPFEKRVFSLTIEDLINSQVAVTTNNLSQIVFITYKNYTICITGDLERKGWELMLRKIEVRELLKITNVFLASHHGRENGYHEDVFNYCKPDCIIISDKEIVHGTQKDMSSLYAGHISNSGVIFKSKNGKHSYRKVITTRSDGHILLNISDTGIDYEGIS